MECLRLFSLNINKGNLFHLPICDIEDRFTKYLFLEHKS